MPLRDDDPTVVDGYVLEDRLGSGGMGVVYLARSASGRLVALKLVHAQYCDDEEFRSRFRQEVAAARRVSGAFTTPVVDADPEARRPWMATLYVPGPTLFDLVSEEGPLDVARVRGLALGLVEALRDIHRAGVVHRDLKPANVLMAEDGPRVIDFGISRACDNLPLTVTGRVIGTPPFMSPEQLRSPRDVTASSDVFSLGSLLVYAASGHSPFKAESPYLAGYQVMFEAPKLDAVPEPLRAIAGRCLDKDPTARPDLTELHRLFLELPASPATGHVVAGTAPAPFDRLTDQGRGDQGRTGQGRTDQGHTDAGQTDAGRAGVGGPYDKTANDRPADDRRVGDRRADDHPADGPRRPRRRATWQLVLVGLGAALTVSAVSAGLLGYAAFEDSSTSSAADTGARYRSLSLPEGWQPWRTPLRNDEGFPAEYVATGYQEPGCLTDGTDLYCGGTGFVVAKVDAATGAMGWRYGTLPQTSHPIGVRDGLVFVYAEPDTTTRRLVALDTATGKQRWARPISASDPVYLYDGGILALAPDHRRLVAYDTAGDELWRTPVPDDVSCVPRVLGDDPYELCWKGREFLDTSPFTLVRLDPEDGTRRELAPLAKKSLPLGAVDGRPLFLAAETTEEVYQAGYERPYNAFLRVDPGTGEVTRIPLERALRGSATLVGGVVYFVRTNGSVTAVSASSGKELWERSTDMENLSAPVVSKARGEIYFANRFGRLLALDSGAGAELWRTDALDDPGDIAAEAPPRVLLVDDAVVAVAGDTAISVSPDDPVRPSVSAAGD